MQSVHQPQGGLNVLLGFGFGVVNGSVIPHKQFACDIIDAAFQEKLMVFAFNHVGVGDFPEAGECDLIVATAEKLPESCFFLGKLGEVFLVGTIQIGLEGQVLFFHHDITRVRA